MLQDSNNKVLDYKGVNPELKFFYQRWQELLHTRTLDMYQYNILNSCVACVELSDVIDKTLSGLLLSRENVEDSKNEAFEILKGDESLKKHDKPLWVALMRILSSKIGRKKVDAAPVGSAKEIISPAIHAAFARVGCGTTLF